VNVATCLFIWSVALVANLVIALPVKFSVEKVGTQSSIAPSQMDRVQNFSVIKAHIFPYI
jgi:hypothetical protein